MLLVKTLKGVGMQENIIDVFLFGLLCIAPSHFARTGKTVDFLFNEENYRQDIDIASAKVLIVDNIKPLIDTAISAMKDFEMETHFAENSDVTAFTTYLEAFIQTENESK